MPTYLYACQSCQTQHEIRHGISEPPPASCPACGRQLERVLTVPRISTGNSSSPTAAKYAKMTPSQEVTYAQAELKARRRPSRRPS